MTNRIFRILSTTLVVFALTACNGNENMTRTGYDNGNADFISRDVKDDNPSFGRMIHKVRSQQDDNGSDRFTKPRRPRYNNVNMDNKGDMNISALNTNMSSKKYPHTKAVLIQDAKYDFIKVNDDQGENWKGIVQNRIRQRLGEIQPGQNQPRQQTGQRTQEKGGEQARPERKAPATNRQQTGQQAPATQKPATGISEFAQQVIDLTNKERERNGLKPLQADAQLSNVAQRKSQDMKQNNYFSHTSPTYGSPFDMIRDFGVSYQTAGENIAQGQRSPEEVVNAWMNSEGHRANILNGKFTHIGVGFESQGYHWTQMFIGK